MPLPHAHWWLSSGVGHVEAASRFEHAQPMAA